MKNAVVGVIVAAALALVVADVSIAGIEAWKIVLAAIGFVLFVGAGRQGVR